MKNTILFDKSVCITTIFCVVLVFGLPVLFFFLFDDFWVQIITLTTCVVPLIICTLFAPRYYLVEKDKIIIKRITGKIVINKNEIESIMLIKPEMLNGLIRKFASGGFCGYWGLFYSDSLKNVNIYAGSLSKNLVLIKLSTNKSYIITPKEIDVFMNKIQTDFDTLKQ
jgi:hypothetical protein